MGYFLRLAYKILLTSAYLAMLTFPLQRDKPWLIVNLLKGEGVYMCVDDFLTLINVYAIISSLISDNQI